jgi:DNA-binding transcriptional regulator YiaG
MPVQRICSSARGTGSGRSLLRPSEAQALMVELASLRDVLSDVADRLRVVEVHAHERARANVRVLETPDRAGMDVPVDRWTGYRANALRRALRMTNEGFAHSLGVAVRTVAKWNAQPDLVPVPELQRVLDTALSRAPEDGKARFRLLAVAPAVMVEVA